MKELLFTPGPVNVSRYVENSIARPALFHRSAEFIECCSQIKSMLLNVNPPASADYEAVLLSGSGTAANEMVLGALGRVIGQVLIPSNGEFGERMVSHAREFMNVTTVHFPWGQEIDLNQVEDTLRAQPEIQGIGLVVHETTTGMINPFREIGHLAKKYQKIFFVDAVSAFGGEDLDLKEADVHFLTGVSGKCIGAYPGISFCLINKGTLEWFKSLKPQRTFRYLDLLYNLEVPNSYEFPFTPPTHIFLSLNAALNEFHREGLSQRIERFRAHRDLLQKYLVANGFTRLFPNESINSSSVMALRLPEGITLNELYEGLLTRRILIRNRKTKISDQVLTIGVMGALSAKDIHYTGKAIQNLIDRNQKNKLSRQANQKQIKNIMG